MFPPLSKEATITRSNVHGFTLIELSVVLVIIGLIVGGVLVGRSLIHAAEIRKTISEKERLDVAINTFRIKYSAIPGDIANAHVFFGTSCGDATTSGETGCNGNGDDLVDVTNVSLRAEEYKIWMHLSLAQLIPGTYTGRVTDINDPYPLAGENLPVAALKKMAWHGVASGNATTPWEAVSRNAFCLGEAQDGTVGCIGSMNVDDAYAIDSKIDDGLPSSGKVFGENGGDCHGATYYENMTPNTEGCALSIYW